MPTSEDLEPPPPLPLFTDLTDIVFSRDNNDKDLADCVYRYFAEEDRANIKEASMTHAHKHCTAHVRTHTYS